MGNQIYNTAPTSSPLPLLNAWDLTMGNSAPSSSQLSKRGVLKSHKCYQQDGLCVTVKLYWKSSDAMEKLHIQQKKYMLRSLLERFQLPKQPNILNYHRVAENEKAICLIRQYCYISLQDRISTRPFLSYMNKLWISYQILHGLSQLRDCNFFHGDLKMTNVLLTTYDWVFLTDLSFYKPIVMPADNPSIFEAFFSNAESSAFLAPERFFESESQDPTQPIEQQFEQAMISPDRQSDQVRRDLKLLHSMDIFSAGCIIAQLFLDVRALFTFEQLLAYRKGSTTHLEDTLKRIKDPNLRGLIYHMLNLVPLERFSADEYCKKWTPSLFPYFFEPLHYIASQMMILCCDERIEKMYLIYNLLVENIMRKEPTPSQIEEVLSQLQQNIFHVEELPRVGCTYQEDLEPLQGTSQIDGMEIIASIVCASVRDAQKVENKVRGLQIMQSLAHHTSDYVRLQRLVPYTCTMVSDSEPLVKCTAIQTLAIILKNIKDFPLSESNLFSDYIFAKLKKLATDESEMVCVCFAEHLPFFATHAKRFLDITIKEQKNNSQDNVLSYEESLSKLQSDILQMVKAVSTHSCIYVIIGLLENIVDLCQFYGITRTNDDVLPMIITFLNARPWRLRHAFFKKIVPISIYIGRLPVQQYILPCISQALYDSSEPVVEQAITDLVLLCQKDMFKKRIIVDISEKILPTLHHPNIWIRSATISFLSVASTKLGPVDSACFLLNILSPHLEYKILNLTEDNLKQCVKTHLPRALFDKASKLTVKQISELREHMQHVDDLWKEFLGPEKIDTRDLELLNLMKDYLCKYSSAQFSKITDPNSKNQDEGSKFYRAGDDLEMITPVPLPKNPETQKTNPQKPPPDTPSDKLCGSSEKKVLPQFIPKGEFCGQSHQHGGAVLAIGVHPSLKWFATGGKDETIRVWDLEKCYAESSFVAKMTYKIGSEYGYVLSVCAFSDSHEESFVAVGTSHGWLLLLDANNGIIIYQVQLDQNGDCKHYDYIKDPSSIIEQGITVLHYVVLKNTPHILCGTQRGLIIAVDARSGSHLFTLKEDTYYQEGSITAICGDSVWIVAGTSRGFLSLWDLRFPFRALHWKLSDVCCNPNSGISALGIKENGDNAPWIFIATRSRDVVKWSLDTQRETQILRLGEISGKIVVKKSKLPTKQVIPIETNSDGRSKSQSDVDSDSYALLEWEQLGSKNRSNVQVTCMHVNPDGSFFTGSSDCRIRYWNPDAMEQSRIIPESKRFEVRYKHDKNNSPPIFEEIFYEIQEHDSASRFEMHMNSGYHFDTITATKVVLCGDVPTLVSASRDGVLMFWR